MVTGANCLSLVLFYICRLDIYCCTFLQEDTWKGPQQWQPEWKKYTGIWDIIDSSLLPGDQEALAHFEQNPPPGDKDEGYLGPVLEFLPLIRVFKEIIVQDAPLRLQLEPKAFMFAACLLDKLTLCKP